MKLEISELILLLAGFLAGMVTFEFCCRAYRIYSDRRQAREADAAEWDKRGDWMPFLKGCREEWKEKAQDSFLATDGMYELREEILDRIFNQLDILEKGKS